MKEINLFKGIYVPETIIPAKREQIALIMNCQRSVLPCVIELRNFDPFVIEDVVLLALFNHFQLIDTRNRITKNIILLKPIIIIYIKSLK